jgi:type I restriction enzyme S subunit
MKTKQKQKLGDYFKLKHGYAFKGEYFSDVGPYIVLTPGNFHEEGGFKLKSKEKYYTGNFPNSFLLKKDDLIVAMTEQGEGLLGSSAVIPKSSLFLHNQRLGLITDLDEQTLNKKFLYYLFNTQSVRAQIRASANGAKVRHTSPGRIYDVEFDYLPIETQRKIASILSAYDDLIENNTRRIKILEEMVRMIYREWFVNFRFPGYEQVKLVDSPLGLIPEEWEVGSINDVVSIKSGFAFKSTTFADEGSYGLVTIKNVQDGQFNPDCSNQIEDLPQRLPDYCMLKDGDILLSLTGNIGRTCLVYGNDLLLNQRVAKLIPLEPQNRAFAYFTFRQDEMRAKLEQISNGVAQQNLSPIETGRMEFCVPSKLVLSRFSVACEPIINQLLVMYKRNINLRQTRDLLLPKLISGEVVV